MAVRRAPTSAGTARTPCRARNAGQQPVRRGAHRRRRLPTMPLQVPGKRSLIERRRSDWAACSKRHSPPGYRPLAKCAEDRGELVLRTPGHEGMRNAWISPIDIPRRGVCHDLGSHRVGEPSLTSAAWSRQIQRVRLVEVHNVRMLTPQDRAETPTRPKCV
jgi:hypothetical protein